VPGDLGRVANLLVLAFSREHQHPIETWLPHLSAMEEDFPRLEIWRLVMLPRGYRLMRGAIENGLRTGISDPGARRHTLVAFVDLDGLRRALYLPDLSDVRLYLLNAEAIVRWEGAGGYGEGSLTTLKAALMQMLGGA
jgi:hypothetical protein